MSTPFNIQSTQKPDESEFLIGSKDFSFVIFTSQANVGKGIGFGLQLNG
jgi:hypothetical protein